MQEKDMTHAARMSMAQLEERLGVSRETIQQLRASLMELERDARKIGNENK